MNFTRDVLGLELISAGFLVKLALKQDYGECPTRSETSFPCPSWQLTRLLRLHSGGGDCRNFDFKGTVRNYVSSLLSKLGVADRTQAAVLALRYGLVDSHE